MTKFMLLRQAILKYTAGILLVSLLLFLPAGTVSYPGAWRFMALLFIPMFFLGLILFLKAPELLEKRLQAKEKEAAQKSAVAWSAFLFLGGFVLAGLDHRFGWSALPRWVTIGASVLLLLSYALYAEVMRENVWLSRTVEIQQGQTVITTGLYAIVRHPMYAATSLLFLSIPLVLGSLVSFCVFLPFPLVLAKRIQHEEAILAQGLEGYRAYQQTVKYQSVILRG